MQHGGDVLCMCCREMVCMHEDRLGNTAGKPFWVFTEKRVSSVQDGFVFTFIFGHFLGKLGFRVKFSLQAQSPLWTWWHTMPSSVPQSGVSNLRDIQLLGRSRAGPWAVGSDVRPKDTMRNEPGMVSWCPAVQQREGGMQKQLIYAISSQPNNRTRIARTLTPGTRRPLWKHETAHGICFYALCNFYIAIQLFICETIICPHLDNSFEFLKRDLSQQHHATGCLPEMLQKTSVVFVTPMKKGWRSEFWGSKLLVNKGVKVIFKRQVQTTQTFFTTMILQAKPFRFEVLT